MGSFDDYMRRAGVAWCSADEGARAIALSHAAAIIDAEADFRGVRHCDEQPLSWPRRNAFYDDGTAIDGFPMLLLNANVFLAGLVLDDLEFDRVALGHVLGILKPLMR